MSNSLAEKQAALEAKVSEQGLGDLIDNLVASDKRKLQLIFDILQVLEDEALNKCTERGALRKIAVLIEEYVK